MTRINFIELKTAISASLPNRLIVLFSILFTAIYIKVAGINTAATVSALATFDADPPFKFRFILPLLLRGIFSLQQLDAKNFHFLFAVPLVMAIFIQQEKFVKKILPSTYAVVGHREITCLVLFLVLLSHYCLPRSLNVYYLYDLPSILFYFYAFNTLTEEKRIPLYAPLIILIGFLSRETLVIALLHAFAYNYFYRKQALLNKRVAIMAGIVATFIVCRLLINHWLGSGVNDNASVSYEGQARFLYNLISLKHDANYRVQALLIGCGAIFWLPFVFRALPFSLKWLCFATIPALGILLWTGNFVELRIYNELVPLFAALLQYFAFTSYQKIQTPTY